MVFCIIFKVLNCRVFYGTCWITVWKISIFSVAVGWLCVLISGSEWWIGNIFCADLFCTKKEHQLITYFPVNTNCKFSLIKTLRPFNIWGFQGGGDGLQTLLWRYAVSLLDAVLGLVHPEYWSSSLPRNVSGYQWTRCNSPEVLAVMVSCFL
jgi:hypothetical protein